jgi:hypothetical protein
MGTGAPLKTPSKLYSFFFIMSRETLLGLLSAGNTGNQILQILDSIVEEVSEQNDQPTLSPVDF